SRSKRAGRFRPTTSPSCTSTPRKAPRRVRASVLILDDILLAPLRGVLWVARKIQAATEEELEGQKQRLSSMLSELYMELDTGKISEREFEAREKVLLAQLDAISGQLRRAKG